MVYIITHVIIYHVLPVGIDLYGFLLAFITLFVSVHICSLRSASCS